MNLLNGGIRIISTFIGSFYKLKIKTLDYGYR